MESAESGRVSERFSGKVALVTGSSRGLGRAISAKLAAEGATVVLNSVRSVLDGQLAARRIAEAGGRAVYVQADVGDEADLRRLAGVVGDRYGRLDLLVHNAAGGVETTAVDAGYAGFEVSLRTNAYALLALTSMLRPLMPPGSRVVYMSSFGAVRAVPGYAVVGAGKAAAEALVRSLAMELAPEGIGVNAVRASVLPTASLRYFSLGEEFLRIARAETPTGLPDLEATADAVLLLCEPAGRYLTGQTVEVDGAWNTSMWRESFRADAAAGAGGGGTGGTGRTGRREVAR